MSPADFTEWRTRLGFSKTAAAEALGISRNMPQKYETGEATIPRYVALACSAVALSLPPYGARSV